ncbi:DUF2345 domain-containing protein [Burkholderia sp. BCC1640]|uniref:DUF2345 domain-containing protein n=1 Tax=Burkholderia sp. BCC1640 TaxID=2676294 RepID=UPI0024462913|nr:DUF2345 domain-containing protein [Burkholderia sp. BCC1640]
MHLMSEKNMRMTSANGRVTIEAKSELILKCGGSYVGISSNGTVPIRSGRAPAPFAKACVAFGGVEHEGAYNPLPCRLFALRAITRLVSNVKGTSMEYTPC